MLDPWAGPWQQIKFISPGLATMKSAGNPDLAVTPAIIDLVPNIFMVADWLTNAAGSVLRAEYTTKYTEPPRRASTRKASSTKCGRTSWHLR